MYISSVSWDSSKYSWSWRTACGIVGFLFLKNICDVLQVTVDYGPFLTHENICKQLLFSFKHMIDLS